MIPYNLPQEKETILRYADILGDELTKNIIERDALQSKEEAVHLAKFFWEMVNASNEEDKKTSEGSEYILEKIIITLMAFFRSSGYEDEWEKISDQQ